MMLPNLEISFGDNLTIIAPSFELDYRFRNDWGVWTPYLGAGIGPIFYSVKNGGSIIGTGRIPSVWYWQGIGRQSVRTFLY